MLELFRWTRARRFREFALDCVARPDGFARSEKKDLNGGIVEQRSAEMET